MASALIARLQPWLERVDALELRERILLLAAGVTVMFILVDTLWLAPVLKHQQVVEERIGILEVKLNAMRQNALLLHDNGSADPLQVHRDERDRLNTELDSLDARIVSQLGALVEPSQAARVLEQLLENYAGLTLTALSASSEPLDSLSAAETDGSGLARYHVDMIINGSYLELLRYLKKLEGLPWKFFWQQVNFQSTGYPTAETRLQLYTLGAGHG
jgi:MSHA biogenesis protein MshJ